MFYEAKHSLSADYFRRETGEDFEYPAHLHHCFEFLSVSEGEMDVEVDGCAYRLGAGDALMIFSNQIHAMKTVGYARHQLALFAPALVNAYTAATASTVPADAQFRPEPADLARLAQCTEQTGVLTLKAVLYALCASFDRGRTYMPVSGRSNLLLEKTLRFIERSGGKACELSSLAEETGYSYSYLSRYFQKTVGIPYNTYVNQYRVGRACYLLSSTAMPVLELSAECGFNAVRSMNRNFQRFTGLTPVEYRRRYAPDADKK